MAKKPILEGHKKVGKKFIPPMMQLANLNEVSYVNDVMPELLWMALLNDKFGYRQGIKLVTLLASKAFNEGGMEQHINFAICSNYNLLSDEQKKTMLDDAEISSSLSNFSTALMPMTKLYENFPLSFLCEHEKEIRTEELMNIMADCVARLRTY